MILTTFPTTNKKNFDLVIRITLGSELDVQDFKSLYDSVDSIYRFQYCCMELDRYLIEVPKYKFDAFHEERELNKSNIRSAVREVIEYEKPHISELLPGIIIIKSRYLGEFGNYFEFELPLVIRTEHASPGFTDILGIGKLIKTLESIITYYFPNKKDKEEAEILRQTRIAKQIENLKSIGFNDIEIRELVLNNDKKELQLKKLIEQGKITESN